MCVTYGLIRMIMWRSRGMLAAAGAGAFFCGRSAPYGHARMGIVLVDIPNASKMPDEPSYAQQCMNNPFDRATAVPRVHDLVHYIADIEKGKVMTLERDGTTVECPNP